MRHLLNLFGPSDAELAHLLREALRLKAERRAGDSSRAEPTLAGKVVALVFEKPSLRTRVSFEAAVAQLGGTSLFLPGNEVGLGWREPHADFARTVGRFVDGVVFRVFHHDTVEKMAAVNAVPVINGLSDRFHPCQGLADMLTIHEHFGGVAGRKVAFVGDGNNVASSLAIACTRLGAQFVLAAPPGYDFPDEFRRTWADHLGGPFPPTLADPAEAVADADVIYTDVWTSMGQEAERDERLRRFAPFQVNESLLEKASPSAVVLHCLPAHRGEEVTAGVIDGPRSLVFDQAENRLHAQKAILEWLLVG